MRSTNWATKPASDQGVLPQSADQNGFPIFICLLGRFRVLKAGQIMTVCAAGKAESLLCCLALRSGYAAPRDFLLDTLWPNSELTLAGQSLSSLVHRMHTLLGDGIGGAAPVVCANGHYLLNVEAGIGVDVACFETLATAGEQHAHGNDRSAAAAAYERALSLYRGDLCIASDAHAVIESERLRAIYLSILARLADYYYDQRDYAACLTHAQRLLSNDSCREEAHRMVMRCYVRRGERAQAFRQFRLCEKILRAEFDAAPEPATQSLFNQTRLDPASI